MSAALPHDYLDRILHNLWQRAPASLLRVALGDPSVVVRKIVEGKTVLLRRDLDGAAILETAHGPCVGHVEFETDADPAALPARMGMYGAVLHAKTGLPVRSAVVLLEPGPKISPRFELRHGGDVLSIYRYRVVRLYRIAAAELAADPDLAILAPLGRGARLKDVAAARDTLDAHASRADRADLLAALYIVGGRAFSRVTLRQILSQEVFMQSDTYLEILEKGIEKGIEKGEKRGEKRGVLLGLRQLVERQVGRRFPEAAPSLTPLLKRCSAEDLEEIGDAVLTVTSAEELRAVIVERVSGD